MLWRERRRRCSECAGKPRLQQKKNAISRAADSTESEPVGAVLGEAVSVVSAQGTRQGVCRIGGAQQVTVTLYRIFAFQRRKPRSGRRS